MPRPEQKTLHVSLGSLAGRTIDSVAETCEQIALHFTDGTHALIGVERSYDMTSVELFGVDRANRLSPYEQCRLGFLTEAEQVERSRLDRLKQYERLRAEFEAGTEVPNP